VEVLTKARAEAGRLIASVAIALVPISKREVNVVESLLLP